LARYDDNRSVLCDFDEINRQAGGLNGFGSARYVAFLETAWASHHFAINLNGVTAI
jgi:hypothetical protein